MVVEGERRRTAIKLFAPARPVVDHPDGSVQIVADQARGQSQRPNPLRCDPFVPNRVSLGITMEVVSLAINLDGQLRPVAIEVEDVRPERMLSAESPAFQGLAAQGDP